MKTSTKALFAAAAMGGILAGTSSLMAAKPGKADAGQSVITLGEKGACSGKDGCGGKDKKDKHSCKSTTKPAEKPAEKPAAPK